MTKVTWSLSVGWDIVPLLCRSIVAALLLVGAIDFSVGQQPANPGGANATGKKCFYCVQGPGSGSWIKNDEFQSKVTKAFDDHRVIYFTDPLSRDSMIRAIQRSDIYLFSGHSGVPSTLPPTHVLTCAEDEKGLLIMAADLATALKNGPKPRLVIINGCHTTDEDDGVPKERRLSTAFGISPGQETPGRAYLGWPKMVPGVLADRQIVKVLEHWTQQAKDGTYPTISESREAIGIKNLTIYGDLDLRYREPTGFKKADCGFLHEQFKNQDAKTTISLSLDETKPDPRAQKLLASWNNNGDTGYDFLTISAEYWASAQEAREQFSKNVESHQSMLADLERARADPEYTKHQTFEARCRFDQSEFVYNVIHKVRNKDSGKGVLWEPHATVEAKVLYRDHFLIRYQRQKDADQDFGADCEAYMQRAKELIDVRFPIDRNHIAGPEFLPPS
jgi:hypothetical protein